MAENVENRMRAGARKPKPDKELRKGDRGAEVETLYGYLKDFGYFPNEEIRVGNLLHRPVVPFDPEDVSNYDDRMAAAVRKFQQQQGLPQTGELGKETLALMQESRCGHPDQPVNGFEQFVIQGNRWPGPTVTYSFDNSTPDLTAAEQRAAVTAAFDRWSAVCGLNFAENAAGGDIRIGWYSAVHCLGSGFDGPHGVLAHCFFPPPNGGDLAGDCHFDETENWSVNTPASGIDLASVALHELGHGLGLSHSTNPAAVMYAYYSSARRELHDDDIQGIQAIYGAKVRWKSLGGVIFDPAVARNQDGRLEVFARGSDSQPYSIAQTTPGGAFASWQGRGGTINGGPCVGKNSDGRLEVFARGTNGTLVHAYQNTPGGSWGGWSSLGGVINDPVVAVNKSGRLEVFARGNDGALYHCWQDASSGTGWSGWASLGGVFSGPPAVAVNTDGRLEVFVRGTSGTLFHKYQNVADTTTNWNGNWESLGGSILGPPAVGRNADGRLEVFAQGTDNSLQHVWFDPSSGSGWSGWASLGGSVGRPAVIANADGRLEVFARGADNSLMRIWQTAPNTAWSGWSSLGGSLSGDPVAAANTDGRLEVFARGADASLLRYTQSAPGSWA